MIKILFKKSWEISSSRLPPGKHQDIANNCSVLWPNWGLGSLRLLSSNGFFVAQALDSITICSSHSDDGTWRRGLFSQITLASAYVIRNLHLALSFLLASLLWYCLNFTPSYAIFCISRKCCFYFKQLLFKREKSFLYIHIITFLAVFITLCIPSGMTSLVPEELPVTLLIIHIGQQWVLFEISLVRLKIWKLLFK